MYKFTCIHVVTVVYIKMCTWICLHTNVSNVHSLIAMYEHVPPYTVYISTCIYIPPQLCLQKKGLEKDSRKKNNHAVSCPYLRETNLIRSWTICAGLVWATPLLPLHVLLTDPYLSSSVSSCPLKDPREDEFRYMSYWVSLASQAAA